MNHKFPAVTYLKIDLGLKWITQ